MRYTERLMDKLRIEQRRPGKFGRFGGRLWISLSSLTMVCSLPLLFFILVVDLRCVLIGQTGYYVEEVVTKLAEIEYHTFTSSKITIGSTTKRTDDIFHKKRWGWYGRDRVFEGPDGREYRWELGTKARVCLLSFFTHHGLVLTWLNPTAIPERRTEYDCSKVPPRVLSDDEERVP